MKPRGKKSKARKAIERDRKIINAALKKCLRKVKGPAVLKKAMEYSLFPGGKRLRPILVLESSKALGGGAEKALPFACALEFIHSFSLVHDDLPSMDDDDFRREKPAVHKKFGEGTAILAGDALLNLAFGTISSSGHKKTAEILAAFADAVGSGGMIGGQALDLRYKNRTKMGPKLKTKIDAMKTASIMALSCRAGALAAYASKKDTEKISAFGKKLGLAFQVADDAEDGGHKTKALKKMRKNVSIFISTAKLKLKRIGRKKEILEYIADKILEKAHGKIS